MIIQVNTLPVTAPDNSIRIMIIASAIGTATHAHLHTFFYHRFQHQLTNSVKWHWPPSVARASDRRLFWRPGPSGKRKVIKDKLQISTDLVDFHNSDNLLTLFVRVPATIMTSAWRGEARKTIPYLCTKKCNMTTFWLGHEFHHDRKNWKGREWPIGHKG